MGCGGSCSCTAMQPVSWSARKPVRVSPEGAVHAPGQAIDNLYVKELNLYLQKIHRKPEKFKMAVHMRKIEACLSECSSENSNHKSKRGDETCYDAAWLSVLTDEIKD
ncbi:unnamed protein product [Symbiodinium necroappetens]|uniref:Uncharacterized protein n=1 Tax=Symbiodinium necroappetens TaxID=1628268 RepID=A0A812RN63_9DINO|nr:unnamed protein product [Symbiodinium necroappetens]|mmetsp:Transcript_78834/g.189196  ORF Transcript_78834/g.189196 Transcript_78834/m.189196 type:complete len:108 (-) Transcript_78834:171-494(-)